MSDNLANKPQNQSQNHAKNQQQALTFVEQLLATLTLTRTNDDTFIGQSHDYVGARIFGGQVLGQALMSASHTVDVDKPCHSLHGYFLRGGMCVILCFIRWKICEMVAVYLLGE